MFQNKARLEQRDFTGNNTIFTEITKNSCFDFGFAHTCPSGFFKKKSLIKLLYYFLDMDINMELKQYQHAMRTEREREYSY